MTGGVATAPRPLTGAWLASAVAVGGVAGAGAIALDVKVFAVTAVAAVFLLSLVYVWRDPKLGLYLAVVTFSLDTLGRLPFSDVPITLYQIAIAVTLVSAFRARRAGRLTLRWRATPIDLPLLLFVLVAFAAVWFAPSARLGAVTFASLLSSILLFYLVVTMVDTPQEARRLLLWFMAIAAVLAIVAMTERVTGVSIAGDVTKTQATGIRVRGSFKDPNMLGLMMMMSLVAGAAIIRDESSRMRLVLGAGGVVVAAALVLSFSRGAWVAALVAVVAVILAYPGDRAKRVVPVIVALALAGSIALSALPPEFVQKRIIQVTQDKSALARVYMAESGLNIISENPLGVGLGGFPSVFPAFRTGTVRPSLVQSHIAYLTVVVELGIPGLLLFLWMLWRSLAAVWPDVRGGRRGPAAAVQLAAWGAVLGILVQALTYSVELSKQLWFALGLLTATHLLLSRDEEADD